MSLPASFLYVVFHCSPGCEFAVTLDLPANTVVEYKYIRKFNGQVTWESDPNNSLTTPADGTFTQNDTWR